MSHTAFFIHNEDEMLKHKDSHTDHVPASVVEWALVRFRDRTGFFIETLSLPDHLPTLDCGLYGPIVGDAPVADEEVNFKVRGERKHLSRMVNKPMRQTRTVTVIAGPHDGEECVLYTLYGGPSCPKEVNDPFLNEEERAKAVDFWSQHALAE